MSAKEGAVFTFSLSGGSTRPPCSPSITPLLTDRRGGHTPFAQAGAETFDTSAEAVKPGPSYSWEGHSDGVGAGVGDEHVFY